MDDDCIKPLIKRKFVSLTSLPCVSSTKLYPKEGLPAKSFQEKVSEQLKNATSLGLLEQPNKQSVNLVKTKKPRNKVECSFCAKKVPNNNIQAHEKTHLNALKKKESYRFSCKSCSFKAKRKSTLDQHQKTHDVKHLALLLARKKLRKQKKSADKLVPEGKASTEAKGDKCLQIGSAQTDVSTQTDFILVDGNVECIGKADKSFQMGTTSSDVFTQTDFLLGDLNVECIGKADKSFQMGTTSTDVLTQTDVILDQCIQKSDKCLQVQTSRKHMSSQTHVIVDQKNETQLSLTVMQIQTKIDVMKEMLNIHYKFLTTAEEHQIGTYYEMLDALINPLRNIFDSIISIQRQGLIDKDQVTDLETQFREIAAEFTEKRQQEEEQKEEEVEFVGDARIVYVPDTNSFIHHFKEMKRLMNMVNDGKCMVALPQKVFSELDGLKHSINIDLAFTARESLRLLEKHKPFYITQPFLKYTEEVFSYEGSSMTTKHDKGDNLIVAYASQLAKKRSDTIIMLSDVDDSTGSSTVVNTEDLCVNQKAGRKKRNCCF